MRADLVGLYQFDDSGQLGKDTSGNDNTASLNGASGGPQFLATGYQGGAATFGASSGDFLEVPINASALAMPQMTWGCWVKPGLDSLNRGILSTDDGGFDRLIGMDGRGGPSYSWSAFNGTDVLNSGVAPLLAGWIFLAAVYDQSLGVLTFYVNDQSFSVSGAYFGSSRSTFEIGGNVAFSQNFTGAIDNVFIYNRALISTEVDTIRTNGFPSAVPEPAGLILMLSGLAFATVACRARRRRPMEGVRSSVKTRHLVF